MGWNTTSRHTKSKRHIRYTTYKMADDVTINQGMMVMLTSTGLAKEAVAEASNKGVVGVATATVVNPAGGTETIKVEEGDFEFVGVGLAQGEVGDACYASNGETFSNAQGTNEPAAGKLVEYIDAAKGVLRLQLA